MTPSVRIGLTISGIFLGGLTAYYQVNSGPGVLLTTLNFWVGAIMAGLAPVATYLIGLMQVSPITKP